MNIFTGSVSLSLFHSAVQLAVWRVMQSRPVHGRACICACESVSLCVCMHVSVCMRVCVCMYVSPYPCCKNACIYTNMQVPSLAADIQAAGGGASALLCACGLAAARAPFSVVSYLISVPWSTYFIVLQYMTMYVCGGCACLSIYMYTIHICAQACTLTQSCFVQPTATCTHKQISILFKHVGQRTSFSSRANPLLNLHRPPQSSVSAVGEC